MSEASRGGHDSRFGEDPQASAGQRAPAAGAGPGVREAGGAAEAGGTGRVAGGAGGAAEAGGTGRVAGGAGGAAEAGGAGRVAGGQRAPGGDSYAWYRRGLALLSRGSPAAAAELLERAAEAEPGARSIREALARAQFDAGRYAQAADNFRQNVEAIPSDDYAH